MNKDNQSEKLELKSEFYDLSVPYKEETAYWKRKDINAEFYIKRTESKNVGYLRIWKNHVKPEHIESEWKNLNNFVESFSLGMQFQGNRKLHYKSCGSFYYMNNDKFPIRNNSDIIAIIKRSKGEVFNYINIFLPALEGKFHMTNQPVSLPQSMPFVPLKFERHILTIIQAEELNDQNDYYEDEQLKRWFLILEELVSREDLREDPVKFVRDFVSHPVCKSKELVDFIKQHLPSAVDHRNGREVVIFKRNEPLHRAFVSKYQNIARQWAKNLVRREILESGGNVEEGGD